MQATNQQFTSNANGITPEEAWKASACILIRQLYKENLIEQQGGLTLVTQATDTERKYFSQ